MKAVFAFFLMVAVSFSTQVQAGGIVCASHGYYDDIVMALQDSSRIATQWATLGNRTNRTRRQNRRLRRLSDQSQQSFIRAIERAKDYSSTLNRFLDESGIRAEYPGNDKDTIRMRLAIEDAIELMLIGLDQITDDTKPDIDGGLPFLTSGYVKLLTATGVGLSHRIYTHVQQPQLFWLEPESRNAQVTPVSPYGSQGGRISEIPALIHSSFLGQVFGLLQKPDTAAAQQFFQNRECWKRHCSLAPGNVDVRELQ